MSLLVMLVGFWVGLFGLEESLGGIVWVGGIKY